MHEGEIVIKKVQGHVPKSGAPREMKANSTQTYRLTREDFSGGPVNLDEIEPGLWLGNVAAAANLPTLEKLAIRSILTIDSCPLPAHVTENPSLRVKYIQASDVPREDLIKHFEDTNNFIRESLEEERNVLVHCYFGVSRSATIVIAYIMSKYRVSYDSALDRVRSKRRFVSPNPGFTNQLKLFSVMSYRIDPQNERYKLFRLRLAADNVRKARRLPVNCMDVVKPDPAVTQEMPDPIVYRCRKCRRVIATKSNLLLHKGKPPGQSPAKQNSLGDVAICNDDESDSEHKEDEVGETACGGSVVMPSPVDNPELKGKEPSLAYVTEQMRRSSISSDQSVVTSSVAVYDNRSPEKDGNCKRIYFIEPLAWMTDIFHNTQGRLYCPKCMAKLGSFNWVMATKCPCGSEIYPAFYLVPSKTEYSTVVQNVQVTV